MKFKSRKQLLAEYREQEKGIPYNDLDRMYWFLSTLGDKHDKILQKSEDLLQKILHNRSFGVIKLTLYEYPMKTDRGRHVGNHLWSPNAGINKDYLKKIISRVRDEIQIINTPAEFLLSGYFKMPTGIKPHEQILYETKVLKPIFKPDGDNVIKCYMDMTSEVITIDDDIFFHLDVVKHYSWLPRVEIIIRYQKCHESEYLYNKIRKRKSVVELMDSGLIDLSIL